MLVGIAIFYKFYHEFAMFLGGGLWLGLGLFLKSQFGVKLLDFLKKTPKFYQFVP